MADYRSDVPPDDARRLLSQAEKGLWRVHPVFFKGVNPLEPDVNLIEGFDLVRGGRRVRVYLTDLEPAEARSFRRALVSKLSSRVSRVLSPFFDKSGHFRPDVTMTPVYRAGRPVQIVLSRPGVRPVRISARDFVGLLQALRDRNEVIIHGKLSTAKGPEDFWIVGSRRVMEPLGMYIQEQRLPLDYFLQKGNILFLNADSIAPALFNRKVKLKKVKYVKRSIWGWSP